MTGLLTVTCAYDDGPGVGLGHRRRCEAIATALASIDGVTVSVAPIGRAPFATDVLVVDSYRRRADDPDLVVHPVVVALDDLDRDLAVDCVIDPGLAADGRAHRRAGRVLAGARYAVVAPDVAAADPRPVTDRVHTVLVTMGAADAAGVGARIAQRLIGAVHHVRLVLGPWGARVVPPGVTPVDAPYGLTAELARADLVVTAGGVTMLEALALGRPCVAVTTAGNQHANVTGAVAVGAARAASAAEAPKIALELVADGAVRRTLAGAARTLVDGGGAHRVADAVTALARALIDTRTAIGARA